jgi:hypothetical protein
MAFANDLRAEDASQRPSHDQQITRAAEGAPQTPDRAVAVRYRVGHGKRERGLDAAAATRRESASTLPTDCASPDPAVPGERTLAMRLPFAVASIVAAAALAAPAAADTPQISVFKVDDTATIPAGAFCSFPITLHTRGKMRVAVSFNKDGTVRQISQNPSLVDTATANGVTVTSADRGLDKFTFNPDGTVFLLSTGVHFKVNGIYYELGLRKILFSGDPNDPSSTVLSFEQHGRFGDDAAAAICPLFG